MNQKEIALKMIEDLRERKEKIKKSILFLNNELTNCDIQIRDIRQSIPKEEIAEKQEKPKETLAQKHNRLTREIAELEIQLGVNPNGL